MKKVLFATVAAVMSTTAAMADVSFSEGRITALMTAANNFESRGINIVENSNKLAVHKTVTAWNQGWNALEGENTVDLDASVHTTTLYTNGPHGTFTVETNNIVDNGDGTATILTGEGVSFEVLASDVYFTWTETVSLRDSRADLVEVTNKDFVTEYRIGEVNGAGSNLVLGISGSDSFDRLIDKVEAGIQDAYDAGFEQGYTAGYDDGFAAAKGVVKN